MTTCAMVMAAHIKQPATYTQLACSQQSRVQGAHDSAARAHGPNRKGQRTGHLLFWVVNLWAETTTPKNVHNRFVPPCPSSAIRAGCHAAVEVTRTVRGLVAVVWSEFSILLSGDELAVGQKL